MTTRADCTVELRFVPNDLSVHDGLVAEPITRFLQVGAVHDEHGLAADGSVLHSHLSLARTVGTLKQNLLSLGLRKHEKTLEKAINFRGDEVGIVDRGDENDTYFITPDMSKSPK